jgi:hypothetical protein
MTINIVAIRKDGLTISTQHNLFGDDATRGNAMHVAHGVIKEWQLHSRRGDSPIVRAFYAVTATSTSDEHFAEIKV